MILCDMDVIIEFLKGNEQVQNKFDSIGRDKIAISVITLMELLYGALN